MHQVKLCRTNPLSEMILNSHISWDIQENGISCQFCTDYSVLGQVIGQGEIGGTVQRVCHCLLTVYHSLEKTLSQECKFWRCFTNIKKSLVVHQFKHVVTRIIFTRRQVCRSFYQRKPSYKLTRPELITG